MIAMMLLALPMPAHAGGTVTTCNEAGLDAALAGGGTVSFNCGGTNSPATITLTSQKTISVSTTIYGGSVITLSGGSSTSLFSVTTGVTLTLNAITLTQGYTSSNGGCLYVNGTLELNDTTITNCQAAGVGVSTNGGAIYLNTGARALLVNVTLSNNLNSGGCQPNGTCFGIGGGIYNDGTLTLTNVTLSGNSARDVGGGIANFGILVLSNVTLSSNSSSCHPYDGSCGNGGGIANGATATLSNVTFTGNSAATRGGGISNAGPATLTNVTISANSAIFGGGINNFMAPLWLTNTIVANSPLGGNCNITFSGSSNLSSDNSCNFGAGRDNVNVMLGPLANNGGPTLTHALLLGSPAVDAGTNVGCPSTDQRGWHRPFGSTCDVGAYERGASLFLPLILK